MKTIYKYAIKISDLQKIRIPTGARVLCAQVQNGQPCIWAEVETDNDLQEVTFQMFGTGHEMGPPPYGKRQYVGTFQTNDGSLVFHLYEIVNDWF